MTPEQISAITAIATILKAMGGLPVWGIIFLIVVGPWVGMIVITGAISKRSDKQASMADKNMAAQNEKAKELAREFQEYVNEIMQAHDKRFETVVRMYENNVKLVDDYNSLSGDLTEIITLSVRTLQGLADKIDHNHFCPVVRKESGKS